MKNLILSSLVVAICMLFGTNVFAQTIAPPSGSGIPIHGAGAKVDHGSFVVYCPEVCEECVCGYKSDLMNGQQWVSDYAQMTVHNSELVWGDGYSNVFWRYDPNSSINTHEIDMEILKTNKDKPEIALLSFDE